MLYFNLQWIESAEQISVFTCYSVYVGTWVNITPNIFVCIINSANPLQKITLANVYGCLRQKFYYSKLIVEQGNP